MRALVLAAAVSLAAGVETSEFRWTRTVDFDGSVPVVIEPDGPMFEHARVGLADLRVVDAGGEQVPWRNLPPPPAGSAQRVIVLNSGRRGGRAVALLDLGARRAVRDRIELDVPDRGFVGRVVVLGADRRKGPFTRLSATGIYDVRGAERARSTTALFPPTDFRFLSVQASGVSRIDGAIVSGTEGRPPAVERRPRSIATRQSGRRTIVTLDFGYLDVPVDELRVSARSPRYNRAVVVETSNDSFGRRWIPVTAARIARFEGSSPGPIPLGARARFVRVRIENGDDPPLAGIRVEASSRSHALVLEGGHARPYRLLYGSPSLRAPDYEFARIPLDPQGPTARGTLGAERRNPAFELPGKSFAERHRWLLQAALVLAAIAVAGAGVLALRRRT
jgi:hypothetical protein